MEDYKKLIELMIRCEKDLKGHRVDRTFSPSSNINEIAFYLYKHGVKVEKGDDING